MDQSQPTVIAAQPAPSVEVPSKKGLFSFLNPLNWFGGSKPKEATNPLQPQTPPITPTEPAASPTTEQPLTPPSTTNPV